MVHPDECFVPIAMSPPAHTRPRPMLRVYAGSSVSALRNSLPVDLEVTVFIIAVAECLQALGEGVGMALRIIERILKSCLAGSRLVANIQ